jgi:hypothetical protein
MSPAVDYPAENRFPFPVTRSPLKLEKPTLFPVPLPPLALQRRFCRRRVTGNG